MVSICKNYIDEYPRKIPAVQNIPLRLDRIREVIGTAIGAKDVVRILRSIGMVVKQNGKGRYLVTPPTYRVDIAREIDLIEEVIRLYGYDRVPITLPNVALRKWTLSPVWIWKKESDNYLSAAGILKSSITVLVIPLLSIIFCLSENDERRSLVRIKNPLTRRSIRYAYNDDLWFAGDLAKNNANNGSFDLKIFEIGTNISSAQRQESFLKKKICWQDF